jgi:hypothetical protein
LKPAISIEELQSELLDLLERVTSLIEKAEVIQVSRPAKDVVEEVGAKRSSHVSARATGVRQQGARSEEPASPPISSPQKPKPSHPWRVPMIGIGVKPKVPAVLPECPCVNPAKEDCAKLVPPGIHTRGSGAAAQYSRCRLNDEPARASTKGQLFGHLCDAQCGRRTSNRYRICAPCRASGQGGAVASSAAS